MERLMISNFLCLGWESAETVRITFQRIPREDYLGYHRGASYVGDLSY
jgi:hypothetical protein